MGLLDAAGNLSELTESLRRSLNLSEYESRAYLALVTNGEISPSRLSQVSGIPRPRAYDVLRSLVETGLASERLGRPVRYAPIDPRHGVIARLGALEAAAQKDLSRRKDSARGLAASLGRMFDDFQQSAGNDQRVIVGGTSSAVWKQLDVLKHQTKKEYVAVAVSATVPPSEIFATETRMLKRGARIRLIRPFPPSMRRHQLESYTKLIKEGMEVRTSDRVEFSFDVSDAANAVIWLNERPSRPPTEAVWLQHRPIARMLVRHFESLWREAGPVDRLLKERVAG